MSIRKSITLLIMSVTCSVAFLSLTACHFPPRLYKMDVRQGNFITPSQVSKLKLGMSKSMVKEIMATPALTHFFEPNRWDYYYYLKPGNGDPIKEKRVIVYFRGDHVSNIETLGIRETEDCVIVEPNPTVVPVDFNPA